MINLGKRCSAVTRPLCVYDVNEGAGEYKHCDIVSAGGIRDQSPFSAYSDKLVYRYLQKNQVAKIYCTDMKRDVRR